MIYAKIKGKLLTSQDTDIIKYLCTQCVLLDTFRVILDETNLLILNNWKSSNFLYAFYLSA